MCLHLNDSNIKPKVAKRKITCYKVLEEYRTDKDSFHTPFRYMDVKLGKTYLDGNEVRIKKFDQCITSGVFHSFKKYKDAVKLMTDISTSGCLFVVECVIPKGTEYYEGTFDREEPCYGSKAIQYTEKILVRRFWCDENNDYLLEYPNSLARIWHEI